MKEFALIGSAGQVIGLVISSTLSVGPCQYLLKIYGVPNIRKGKLSTSKRNLSKARHAALTYRTDSLVIDLTEY